MFTCFDHLWGKVPVLSRRQNSVFSRIAFSLRRTGCSEYFGPLGDFVVFGSLTPQLYY